MSPDRLELLRECRELARIRLHETLNDSVVKVEKDVLRRLDHAITRTESDVFFNAMAQLKTNRAAMLQSFSVCYVNLFEEQLRRGGAPVSASSAADNDEIGLVDAAEMDRRLENDRLIRRLTDSINADECNALRIRVAHLFERSSLNDHDNPFSANNALDALAKAWTETQCAEEVRFALLHSFQPYLSVGIDHANAEVNRALVARGILPKIKLAINRGAGAHGVGGSAGGTVGDDDGGGAPVGGGAVMGGAVGGGMPDMPSEVAAVEAAIAKQINPRTHASMERLMSAVEMVARQNMPIDQALSQAMPMGKVVPGVMFGSSAHVPKAVRLEAARVLSDSRALTSMQGQAPAPALVEHLTSMQNSFEPAYAEAGMDGQPVVLRRADVLAQLGENASHASVIDQVTIDLVGEMFETIIANPAVNEIVKTQLLRLQIVTVKAALLDRSFFANEQHAVRKFIELIISAGSDPAIEIVPNGSFLVVLRGIVGEIIETFKDDLGIFEDCHERLVNLIAEAKAQRQTDLEATQEELLKQERLAQLTVRAEHEVEGRGDPEAPVFVQEFMKTWWVRALVDSETNKRTGDNGWEARAQLVTDLMWSLHTRSGAEIETLAKVVSRVVRGLLNGMLAIGMPRDERVSFSNQLLQLHTKIVKAAKEAAMRGPAVTTVLRPVPRAEPPAAPIPSSSVTHDGSAAVVPGTATINASPGINLDGPKLAPPAPPVELITISRRPSPPAPPIIPPLPPKAVDEAHAATDRFDIDAKRLRNGDVVEFVETKVRARLMWVSPSRHSYLFLSPGTRHPMSHSEVVGLLRTGKLRTTEAVKSAVKTLIDHLEDEMPAVAA